VRVIEDKLKGQGDLALNIYRWLPDEPKAALLISHGWSEHAGRYHDLALWFAGKGYEVHALDHRGHGKSEGLPGHVDDWSDYVEDLERLRQSVTPEKQFLLGHSMGGMVAVLHMLQYPGVFQSSVLSGPGMDMSYPVPTYKVLMSKGLSKVWPTLRMNSNVDPAIVCGNPEIVKAYESDPYNHGKASVSWFLGYLESIAFVKGHAQNLETPVAIWHGENDALVEPWVSEAFHKSLSRCANKRAIVPDALHEVLYEENWQQTAQEMLSWIEE